MRFYQIRTKDSSMTKLAIQAKATQLTIIIILKTVNNLLSKTFLINSEVQVDSEMVVVIHKKSIFKIFLLKCLAENSISSETEEEKHIKMKKQ